MEAIRLKNDFHRLIDKFTDVKMLEQFYEVLSDYQNQKIEADIFDELTKPQQKRLKASAKQAQAGNTVSHEDVKGKIKDWLTE